MKKTVKIALIASGGICAVSALILTAVYAFGLYRRVKGIARKLPIINEKKEISYE